MDKKSEKVTADFKHLFDLCRALRLAQLGDLVRGIQPSPIDARRLEAALDFFLEEHGGRQELRFGRD